jgi:hypothetical protein
MWEFCVFSCFRVGEWKNTFLVTLNGFANGTVINKLGLYKFIKIIPKNTKNGLKVKVIIFKTSYSICYTYVLILS